MLLANFNGKEHLRHRAVSLRQHGFLVKKVLGFKSDFYSPAVDTSVGDDWSVVLR